MGFRLTIAAGLQVGRTAALTQPEVRIGRSAENDLVLQDSGVSRRHACIFERGGRYLVQDEGSANGTELNEAPLLQVRELRDGDRLRLGPVELVFTRTPDMARPTGALAANVAQPPSALGLPSTSQACWGPPGTRATARGAGRRVGSGSLDRRLRRTWDGAVIRGRLPWRGVALAALLGLACAVAGLLGSRQADDAPAGREPAELTGTPLQASFGLGEGVTWVRPDMKAFSFELASPTRVVGLLRYEAQGISLQEVSISLNGAEQGWVPPDAGPSRELELVLPPSVLRRSGHNQLIFHNVRNPPGRDPWRVARLRVEFLPVPELGAAELLASARESAARARSYALQRAVGSENLFRAWKQYRAAWVALEALDERPELYRDVRYALGQVSADLDRECSRLLLSLQRGLQYRDPAAVREALEDVQRHFPTREHRCHALALEQRSRYAP